MAHTTRPLLTERDTRALIRLLGEVAAAQGTLSQKRALLMDGLCQLIQIDAWYWAMLGRAEPGQLPSFSINLKGGFTDQQFADYLAAQEHPDMKLLNAPIIEELITKKRHLTRLRQQIDKEGNFPKTNVYALWRKADIAPLILSLRPLATGKVSALALFRRFDHPLFNERESRIAHILLSEVPWLHEESWPKHPNEDLQQLSPRLNTILNLLLQGETRKEIAYQLDISINTVSGYARDLYRRFEVHSQSELIRRFIEGDGGDTPN